MITTEQLAARKSGIGSSDCGAVLGLCPWKTSYDVWAEKTGRVEPSIAVKGGAMWVGNQLEGTILDMAAEWLGVSVVRPPDSVESTFVRGILRANVDGMVGSFGAGREIVEAKATGVAWDGVPPHILMQVRHQMYCANSDVAYIARLGLGQGTEFDVLRVDRDPSVEMEMVEQLEAWWQVYVVGDRPPHDGTPDAMRKAKRTDAEVAVPVELFARDLAAREAVKVANGEASVARAALMLALGDASTGVAPGWRVKVVDVQRSSHDLDALERDHPGLLRQFSKASSYKRVDVRGGRQTETGA